MADKIALVVDIGSDDCLEQFQGCLNLLYDRRILVNPEEFHGSQSKTPADIFTIATKHDLPEAGEHLDLLKELIPPGWFLTTVSIYDPESLENLRKIIFDQLQIIRIYSKIPGEDPDMSKPFILKKGETVLELAAHVHRDFPERLKHARVWGSAKFPGQSVEKSYCPADGDIVELHV